MSPLPRQSHTNGVIYKYPPSHPSHDHHYFLSADAAHALPNFVYAGEDKSLLYRYILSPIAAFFVNRCTPRTLAPNTITLIGLCLMVVSYSIIWYYVPDLEVDLTLPPPSWIFFFNGTAMLVYQTLDNMDGKQARRTGSSSPLGLLFDHGCDAVNSVFGSANWIIAMGMHPTRDFLSFWILTIGPMALFYVATWEEYFTGALILPIVNGPSEGLFGGAMLSITTGFLGIAFWQGTYWFDSMVEPFIVPLLPSPLQSLIPSEGLRNADIVIIASTLGFIQEMCLKSISVARAYGVKSLCNLFPILAMSILWFVIGMCDKDIWIHMPRTSLHLCSGLFVEMSSQLMLDHITAERFRPLRWILLPLMILAALVASGQWGPSRMTDEYLLTYTAALWAFLLMKMSLVIHEICAVLNIWCFDIVTQRKNAVPQVMENGVAHSNGAVHTNLTTSSTLRKTK